MISKRATGINLLNHLKQKYDYKLEYEKIDDKYNKHHQHWITKFEFNNKVYEVICRTKRKVIEKILEEALEDIYSIIKVKE